MKYPIHRILGEGTFAFTFLSEDESGNSVVVKRFKTPIQYKNENKWEREAQLLSTLEHPQIPRYIDHFVDKVEGRRLPHLVMAFVEGQTLAEVHAGGSLREEQVLEWVHQLLSILCYLQAISPPVIHRDIKPSNLLLRADGQVVLIDFGTAIDDVHRTFGGTLAAGTLGYQAPEQFRGEPTLRSDLYSVGALVVACLTGENPSTLLDDRMRMRWEEKCMHLRMPLQRWLDKMLAYDEGDRFADAESARNGLSKIRQTQGGLVSPPLAAVLRRPKDETPNVFLQRLEERKEEHRKEQEGKRRALLVAAERQREEDERKEQERLLTQRRHNEADRRKSDALAQLNQLEEALVAEMDTAWAHGIAALGSQSILINDLLSTYRETYEDRMMITADGFTRTVEHPFLSFSLSYTKDRYGEESIGYWDAIESKFFSAVDSDAEILYKREELRVLKLARSDAEDALAELGLLSGLFQRGTYERTRDTCIEKCEAKQREIDELYAQKTQHIFKANWLPFYAQVPGRDVLQKEVAETRRHIEAERQRKESLQRRQGRWKQAGRSIMKLFPLKEIHPGTFWMGALDKDGEARDGERPHHNVTLTKVFWMSVYPCTQELYEAVMGGENPSHFTGAKRPVEKVSWCDAVVFCNKLSELEGLEPCYMLPAGLEKACQEHWFRDRLDALSMQVRWKQSANGYRLPTEAEWEYCARAGGSSIYAGHDRADEVGWYDANSGDETHPVGQKSANAFGLYDMSGNVWEWVFDSWRRAYSGSIVNPVYVDASVSERIVRGGAWCGTTTDMRTSDRRKNAASERDPFRGFRFVLSGSSSPDLSGGV
ncbi:MAG: bifunctional serine/threonine-protein kinase/formylglycine-generating enzyme family protein [Myxococcota bacterium]|nr:bifunctional serine/threonine-protein kinase/formylglycine-generating enzyme family protein [Myxococcota bacterium]